ncbi:MAG: zinc finger Ran-binding domain-containing protein [Acidobacteria bacterium]|nr:zinc finger Ran-binding domain-containing protein [Acidobacteriota bacterium]
MNSAKCKKCGLSNFAVDPECRRCGAPLSTKQGSRQARPRFSVLSILIVPAVAIGVYYILFGTRDSVADVNSREANRVGVQPAQPSDAGLSRSEYDRQRAQRVGNALSLNPDLEKHTNRTKETEKTIEHLSNSSSR